MALGVPDRFIEADAMILQEGKRVLESSYPTSTPRARAAREILAEKMFAARQDLPRRFCLSIQRAVCRTSYIAAKICVGFGVGNPRRYRRN